MRLQGNLSAVQERLLCNSITKPCFCPVANLLHQEACGRFIYKPPSWFVGEDIIVVRASDGGLDGSGGNLTGELGFRVQAPSLKSSFEKART